MACVTGAGANAVSTAFPNGAELRLESGRLAHLADGSCVASMGSTQVLVTAVCAAEPVPAAEADGPPLQVGRLGHRRLGMQIQQRWVHVQRSRRGSHGQLAGASD